jgi:cell division protein FtsL
MSRSQVYQLRPFVSVIFIISTLFIVVFFQMEERRLGYQVLKLNKEHKNRISEFREKEIQLAKVTRPQLMDSIAQRKFTFKKVQASQIIHITGNLAVGNPTLNKFNFSQQQDSNLETP